MSSNFGKLWRNFLLRIFHKIDTSAQGGSFSYRKMSELPQASIQASSVVMTPFRFRSFNLTTYMSSFPKSYCSRMKPNLKSTFFFFPRLAKWILGFLLSFFLPNWNKLQALGDEAERVMEKAEKVAEVVEKVAEITDKVSTDIMEKLSENSKLKEAAQVVENYSKEIAHDAHLTQDILHKVEDWKQKIGTSSLTAVNELIKKN